MKKLFALILFLILVSFLCVKNIQLSIVCFPFQNANLELYCKNYNNEIEKFDVLIIENEEEFILKTKASNINHIKKYVMDCYGLCLKFRKDECEPYLELINRMQVAKIEIIDDMKIFYGYINGFPFSTFIEKQKVNVQIALKEDMVVIGSPIILGSY